jgi:hypothetical protein
MAISADLLDVWQVRIPDTDFGAKLSPLHGPEDFDAAVLHATLLTCPLAAVGQVFNSKSAPPQHLHVIV